MGIFSAYLGNTKPTKQLVAGRIAALIKCVNYDEGVDRLIAGKIVLRNDFSVSFCGSGRLPVLNAVTKVALEGLLPDNEVRDETTWLLNKNTIVDRLTYAVITELEKQTPGFANLDPMFKPVGSYVFVGKSAKYREAEKKEDKNEMERLLRYADQSHYLMETYESIGLARARADEMAANFVGGVVDCFELPFGVII